MPPAEYEDWHESSQHALFGFNLKFCNMQVEFAGNKSSRPDYFMSGAFYCLVCKWHPLHIACTA
jgi:hypothetical protein